MANVKKLLTRAITKIGHMSNGEEFIVKELFEEDEWSQIPIVDRLSLGSRFLRHVRTSRSNLEPTDKTSAGQQRYKVNRG
ncbi:MAG: single-stranded DNA-binding protein [Synergistaceae bacterium]|nr:single-stranded DNA-binding protein [Synergistaceae bacterium]